MNNFISKERREYLKNNRKRGIFVLITQLAILIGFLAIWEILANMNVIDSFITSQPSRIWETLTNLGSNDLLMHIKVTVYETVVGFLLGTILGSIIAIILWWSKFLSKVLEPFLVVLNSLPKVALRTCNYYLGRSMYPCNYCYGSCYFISSNNFRKFEWIYKNR